MNRWIKKYSRQSPNSQAKAFVVIKNDDKKKTLGFETFWAGVELLETERGRNRVLLEVEDGT